MEFINAFGEKFHKQFVVIEQSDDFLIVNSIHEEYLMAIGHIMIDISNMAELYGKDGDMFDIGPLVKKHDSDSIKIRYKKKDWTAPCEATYSILEYDQLVRIKDWKGIIAKAEKQTPDKPMSVCANNLALAMTNQLGERVFDFYQRGSEGLLPSFERNFSTIQLTGEVYFYLGLVNTAQRLAFEAMEAIPDYSKSGRMMKRLAETNLINGEYEVARKYLQMLDKTIFYRPWAQQALAMIDDETQIDAHPVYSTLRQFRLEDDFLFSEDELDKICGQLFMHDQKNQMAIQYLVMAPLLDGDAQRFFNYVTYVQSKVNYNPRYVREAIAKIRTTR